MPILLLYENDFANILFSMVFPYPLLFLNNFIRSCSLTASFVNANSYISESIMCVCVCVCAHVS